METTRAKRHHIRKNILNRINRRVNATMEAYGALFKLAGRCIYVVKIESPDLVIVSLRSSTPLSEAPANTFSNKTLYAKNKYWGMVELIKGTWTFKRETRINHSWSVGSDSTLLEVRIKDLGELFTKAQLQEAFVDYRHE